MGEEGEEKAKYDRKRVAASTIIANGKQQRQRLSHSVRGSQMRTINTGTHQPQHASFLEMNEEPTMRSSPTRHAMPELSLHNLPGGMITRYSKRR